MRALEGSWDARSVYTKKTNTNTLGLVPQEDSETIIPATPRLPNNYASGFEAIRIRRAFEDDLEASRVYTRAALYDFCDRSFVSSAIRTSAWSILSLSDISVISVLALPLFQGDISNQEHYSFGDIDAAQVLGSAALRTMGQSVAQNKLPPIIVNSLEGDGKRDDIVITQSTELVVSGTSRDAENTTPLPKDDGYDEWYAKNIYLCKGCGKPPRDDDDDLLIISKSTPACTVNIHPNHLHRGNQMARALLPQLEFLPLSLRADWVRHFSQRPALLRPVHASPHLDVGRQHRKKVLCANRATRILRAMPVCPASRQAFPSTQNRQCQTGQQAARGRYCGPSCARVVERKQTCNAVPEHRTHVPRPDLLRTNARSRILDHHRSQSTISVVRINHSTLRNGLINGPHQSHGECSVGKAIIHVLALLHL
jgi:hypothetical protein